MAMWLDKQDVWGYAPSTLKRYAEFMAFTQGEPPEGANQYLDFTQFHLLHAMLRWRYAFLADKNGDRILTTKSSMPRLRCSRNTASSMVRDAIFQAMTSPTFDPQQQVILETEPTPAPTFFSEKGTASVVDSSPGQLTVEADLPHPAILLADRARVSMAWNMGGLAGRSNLAAGFVSATRRYRAPLATTTARAFARSPLGTSAASKGSRWPP